LTHVSPAQEFKENVCLLFMLFKRHEEVRKNFEMIFALSIDIKNRRYYASKIK